MSSLAGERLRLTQTDEEGRFVTDLPVRARVVIGIEAAGLSPLRQEWDPGARPGPLQLVMTPALQERIVTTATRVPTRLSETGASVSVLSSDDLAATAAVRLDDALRQIPGFSLFRRTGSRTANPTTQGVSLRGIAASGASRALVLDDGIPLNDPFGGWVQWGRVPRAALERVEVMEGGASDLYGSAALAGAVAFVRRDDRAPFLAVDGTAGTEDTQGLSVAAGGRRGPWGGVAAAEGFHTDGAIPVREEDRGEVDTPAGSRDLVGDLTGTRDLGSGGTLTARASWFDESRHNGTELQRNDTNIRQGVLGWDRAGEAGSWSVRLDASHERYNQTFSAVAADRESETLTRDQHVPSDAWGVSAQWSRPEEVSHRIVAGADVRVVDGTSDEEIFTPGGTTLVSAGGRQRAAGLFVEDAFQAGSRLTLTAGVRGDEWRNGEGHRTTNGSRTGFESRSESSVSPRLSALWRAGGRLSLFGSAYHSFRAPTLNELYRNFRVGNVVTLANESLDAEKLTGGEAGLRVATTGGRLLARGTLFQSSVEDPVANVTVSATPALITRQRENLGRLRSRGVDLELECRPAAGWALSGGYLFADATVRDFPADRSLEGLRVPQVPRHEITAQGLYHTPRFGALSLQARWMSRQFDDDANRFPLDDGLLVDGMYSHAVGRRGWEAYVAAENLLDQEIESGRTPTPTVLPPATVRAGLRLSLGP